MMKLLLPSVIVALALAGSAQAQSVTIVDDGPPFHWRIVPTWMDVSEVLNRYVAGNTPQREVTVECLLNKGYRPDNCVVAEEPGDSALAKSAAEIAKLYKAYSTDESGKSTIGRRVRFGFHYAGSVF
jgi:hypothetical protein